MVQEFPQGVHWDQLLFQLFWRVEQFAFHGILHKFPAAAYPVSITPGSSLCSRTLGCLIFSVASCEVFTATTSRTWNSPEQTEDNSLWPEEYDKVVLRAAFFLQWPLTHLPMAPRVNYPKEVDNLELLQPTPCAYADDLAMAASEMDTVRRLTQRNRMNQKSHVLCLL